MKTKSGMEYEYRQGSARLIDLAERRIPAGEEWMKDNLNPGDRVTVLFYSDDADEVPHRYSMQKPPEKVPVDPQRTDLDQARGVVHYPHNCGRCLSEDIMRGQVTGTYICRRCVVGLGVSFPTEPTIRLNGRTYLLSDFAKVAAAQISSDVR